MLIDGQGFVPAHIETDDEVALSHEQPYTIEYLEANAQAEYTISTITLYEVYAGTIRSAATSETIETIRDAIA